MKQSPSLTPALKTPKRWRRHAFLGSLLALALAQTAPTANAQKAGGTPDPEAILKSFVVKASAPRALPKIAVQPSLAANLEDVTIHSVVRGDLELCGEFRVLADSDAPDALYLSDTPVDVEAWKKKGVESVIKVSGKKLKDGRVELKGLAYFVSSGDAPVYDKSKTVDAEDVRIESHRMADALIGALTGTSGAFASEMAFVFGHGRQRRVYVMDADGHDPHPISPTDQLALSPTFGPDHEVYYSGSRNRGRFRLYEAGQEKPLPFGHRGSVYGVAFSPNRDQVAVSLAEGPTIRVFSGPNLQSLKLASPVKMALHPTWTPSGKLAFSGAGRYSQRIYVDGKAISPDGLSASAPDFCRHPDGVRAIYAVGVGKNSDLVATGERGGGLARLTQNSGQNSYPACSPDGRLVAFFSTRKSGQGPGLYIMRLDGSRPVRISTLVGDTLRWARVLDTKKKITKKKKPDVQKNRNK